MKILDEIIINKKQEIKEKKRYNSISFLSSIPSNFIRKNFLTLLNKNERNTKLIAEIKHSSPSTGIIDDRKNISERIKIYQESGAFAISYITDEKFFNGNISMISKLRQSISIPILQKDFIIDKYQIEEARIKGGDALLLMAMILDYKILSYFVDICLSYQIEPIVEVYDEKDLEKALKTKTRIIGVNARNFKDFSVSINHACNIIRQIPKNIKIIGFSGIKTHEDILLYKNAGSDAFLVGTSIMQSKNLKYDIKNLIYG